jgi:curli biogenesis system outer membrane secretion channel CsgG
MTMMMMMMITGLIFTTITSTLAAKADTAKRPYQIPRRKMTLGKFKVQYRPT